MRVVIIGLNSDIGYHLANKYASIGYEVLGTCRTNTARVSKFNTYLRDVRDTGDIDRFVSNCLEWDLFISAVGDLKPVGRFFDTDLGEWNRSINVNALAQLNILHKIYQYRNKDKVVDAVFFAGGGVSRPVVDYSAYTLSKVMLIKMCEIINDEYSDINPFIIGPSWVKTKIHQNTPPTAYNYDTVTKFLASDNGTSMDDIFSFIEQIRAFGKCAGGRNFYIYDTLDKQRLEKDTTLLKLRRVE